MTQDVLTPPGLGFGVKTFSGNKRAAKTSVNWPVLKQQLISKRLREMPRYNAISQHKPQMMRILEEQAPRTQTVITCLCKTEEKKDNPMLLHAKY